MIPRSGVSLRRWAAAILVSLAAACAPRSDIDPSKLPPELAVPAGATRVVPRGDGATFAVQYRLAASYPAEDFLRDLKARLAGRGWKPMEHGLLNPQIPTAHVRGWTAMVDPRSRPPLGAHRWQASWTNERGDVVDYNLEYAVAANTIDQPPAPDASLSVTAFLYPASQARAMAAEAERLRKR